jgi:hypothetical protein
LTKYSVFSLLELEKVGFKPFFRVRGFLALLDMELEVLSFLEILTGFNKNWYYFNKKITLIRKKI